jgi:D-glycero-D-manno-heptose 1,7-bisphosphate phosphatase
LTISPLRLAVFLDRDGTLNATTVREGKPYPPATAEELEILAGVREGCAQLEAAGYILVVATNQPDVGRGSQNRETVEAIHTRLIDLIPQIALIQVCYHPGTQYGSICDCRKPQPGMLLDAARQLNLDLKQSWMVGDRWRDIDCGHAAGCRTILIDYGYEEKLKTLPDFIVKSFSEATSTILARTHRNPQATQPNLK